MTFSDVITTVQNLIPPRFTILKRRQSVRRSTSVSELSNSSAAGSTVNDEQHDQSPQGVDQKPLTGFDFSIIDPVMIHMPSPIGLEFEFPHERSMDGAPSLFSKSKSLGSRASANVAFSQRGSDDTNEVFTARNATAADRTVNMWCPDVMDQALQLDSSTKALFRENLYGPPVTFADPFSTYQACSSNVHNWFPPSWSTNLLPQHLWNPLLSSPSPNTVCPPSSSTR